MTPFIGQIMLFAFPRVPQGWASCQGQLMGIKDNEVLYSLLGTTYGGDGRVSFGLPDLRGRVPVHHGQGRGLSSYALGQVGGAEMVTLTENTLARHSHALQAAGQNPATGATATPGPQVEYAAAEGLSPYTSAPSGTPATLAPETVGQSDGGGHPHDNMMPTQVMNYCIALEGIFPPRN